MSKTTIHLTGILGNLITFILLLIFLWLTIEAAQRLSTCEQEESPSCYMFTCPNTAYAPCGNAAYRVGGDGNIYCSGAASTPVQDFDLSS